MELNNLKNELFPQCSVIIGSNVEELRRTIREKLLKPIRFLQDVNFRYVNIEEDNVADMVFTNETQKNYAFLYAAFAMDTSVKLQELYEQGADVNFLYPGENFNALHLSALHGSLECTRWLLEHGCPIVNTSNDLSPLHFAALGNSKSICHFLVGNGCEVDSKALHITVWTNAVECFDYFLAQKAPVNEYDLCGYTELHVAAYLNHYKIIGSLLRSRRVNVNVETRFREYTALHLAAENGFLDCSKILVQYGADVNASSAKGQTPLHVTCRENFLDCVEYLLEQGAAVNARDSEGKTPLHAAVSRTLKNPFQIHIVRGLIERGADVHLADRSGYTALHVAALNELDGCVEQLILSGANVAAKTKRNMTALNIMNRKTPNSCSKIGERLDLCLAYNTEELLKFNFRDVNRNSKVGEVGYLYTLQKEGQARVLEHPISKAFLHLKWQKVRIFILIRLVISVVNILLLSLLISWGISDPKCYHELLTPILGGPSVYENSSSTSNSTEMPCWNTTNIVDEFFATHQSFPPGIFAFIIIMLLLNTVRIIFTLRAYKSFEKFFIKYSNLIEILVTVCVPLNLINMNETILYVDGIDDDILRKSLAGLTLLCSWAYLMIMASQFPAIGAYVAMFKKVLKEFLKMNIAFLSLLMGFTFFFGILMPKDFGNPVVGFTKIMAMMTGELNAKDLMADDTKVPMEIYMTALILSAFMVIVTVVLMNLLVGIAVADVEGLRKNAELTKLIQQTKLIHFIEKACSTGFLAPYVMDLLRKFLYVWPDSYTGVVMYVRPVSPKETRLPRDVMDAGLEIALNRLKKKKLKEAGKKPSVEDRLRSVEGQVLEMKEMVYNLLQATLQDKATKVNDIETTAECEDVAQE